MASDLMIAGREKEQGEIPMATYAAEQVATRVRPAVSADVPVMAAKITAPAVPDR